MQPRDRVRAALTRASGGSRDAKLVAFLTAGYPKRSEFLDVLRRVATAADVVEIGVPFSDPMADGVTIQRASHSAIEQGVTLRFILDELERRDYDLAAPVLLMSYLNPLLAFGYETLARRAAEVGVSGFIVPDLPYEESAPLRAAFGEQGLALVQLVTPATPAARLKTLGAVSEGFVYAVTRTGITGGQTVLPPELAGYFDAVKGSTALPVCAGFGVRSAEQVAQIAEHVDGVIVGSALIEVLERGEDPEEFLRALQPKRLLR